MEEININSQTTKYLIRKSEENLLNDFKKLKRRRKNQGLDESDLEDEMDEINELFHRSNPGHSPDIGMSESKLHLKGGSSPGEATLMVSSSDDDLGLQEKEDKFQCRPNEKISVIPCKNSQWLSDNNMSYKELELAKERLKIRKMEMMFEKSYENLKDKILVLKLRYEEAQQCISEKDKQIKILKENNEQLMQLNLNYQTDFFQKIMNVAENGERLKAIDPEESDGVALSETVDLPNGISIPRGKWRDIRSRSSSSLIVKDLAGAIWDQDILRNKSVTGRKCPLKDSLAKPPLTPLKKEAISITFRKILEERGTHRSLVEVEMNNVNRYLREKINDLQKRHKKVERTQSLSVTPISSNNISKIKILPLSSVSKEHFVKCRKVSL